MKVVIFWFRRDLSLKDNHGLLKALTSGYPVIPVFIFNKEIIAELHSNDSRISFIYDNLFKINQELKKYNSSLLILHDYVENAFVKIVEEFDVKSVYSNEDYEPSAIAGDKKVSALLSGKGINFYSFKNQVIFAKNDILKKDGNPYTVFTPYKKAWLARFKPEENAVHYQSEGYLSMFNKSDYVFPSLNELGFTGGIYTVRPFLPESIADYDQHRDFPYLDAGSYLGPHLRFGTISIRNVVQIAYKQNETFLSELIWREFFMQILFHFPYSEKNNFKKQFDFVKWRNNEEEFKLWCDGKTGYPIVDAGMNQLNKTGYMHNRLRMITAGFLVKHLLIDWRWGEAYFAEKLLDYELSSNVGNWQWAAGTGCDAVPYFRVFNPHRQQEKFDKDYKYICTHIPDFDINNYISPVVNHEFARKRAVDTYKKTKNTESI